MQSDKRIFDDLSKFLNGVAGTVAGMGREAEAEELKARVAALEAASGKPKAAPKAAAKPAPKPKAAPKK